MFLYTKNDFDSIKSLKASSFKFIVLARHGEIKVRPNDKAYNRDKHMQPQDIVHISKKGQKQLFEIGKILKKQKFRINKIFVSPETRAKESVKKLIEGVGNNNLEWQEKTSLDEIDDPRTYLAKIPIKDILNIPKNPNLQKRLDSINYQAETPQNTAKRMLKFFNSCSKKLTVGYTDILISHGHPIAILTHQLINPGQKAVNGDKLRDKPYYCPKGNALVCVVSPDNQLTALYFLKKRRPGLVC